MATSWRGKSRCGLTANQLTELHFSAAIHAVIPRNAERTRLDAHRHRIASMKAIVVIEIHGQALDFLSWAPGVNKQSARAPDDSRHVVAAIHGSRKVGHVLLRVQLPVHKQRSGQNPWERN